MSPRIALDNYYVILYSIITVSTSIFVSYFIFLKAKKTPLLYLYLLTQLMLIIWVFSKIFKTVAPNIHMRWFFIVLQYLGICFLGSVFVMFAFTYSTGRIMKIKHSIILNIPPAASFIVILTNPLHMKFYSYFDMYRDSFGPLFYLLQAITYFYLVCGIMLCAKDFRKQFGHRRVQAILFGAAIFFPVSVNLLYVFKILKKVFGIRLPMDITPISCIASLLIFALAAFKYRFLDITPLAYKEALQQSSDSIMLVDENARIIEQNMAFRSSFHQVLSSHRVSSVFEFINCLQEYTQNSNLEILRKKLSDLNLSEEPTDLSFNNGSCFKVFIEPVSDNNLNPCGTLIRFVDDTKRKQILDSLTIKNKELSEANQNLEKKAEVLRQLTTAKVRNYMAKEVHDILGHSVVLVVSMLEVALINLKKGTNEIAEYINHSIILLKNGLAEIENSTRENSSSKTGNVSLLKSIQLISKQVKSSGITLDITVQGQSYELESKHADNIYKICREAITNSIRHGKASIINIILRFSNNRYELYILDNGIGCSNITSGMGLKGMEERAAEIGGMLQYTSNSDCGFNIYLSVIDKTSQAI